MTVITISTVGFTEVRPLGTAGRIHTILLIVFGVGTVATTLSVLFEQLFHRQLKIIMEKHGMQRTIATLSGHTIVCGFGRMGRMLATNLQKAGQLVVVIERVSSTAEKIEQLGFLVVLGNASDEETLSKAGIERAASLVATLGTDADNLFLTLAEGHVRQELGGMVLAIRNRAGRILFDPPPHTRIDEGDTLYVIGSSASTKA